MSKITIYNSQPNPIVMTEVTLSGVANADQGEILFKDVGGITEFFYEDSNGTQTQITSNGTIVGVGAGAPVGAQYLVLAADATLTNERVFTAGGGISVVDGGAGGAYTVSLASSGVGAAFVQGGNTFAGTATLGTNDDFSLVLETNNIARFTVTAGATPGRMQGPDGDGTRPTYSFSSGTALGMYRHTATAGLRLVSGVEISLGSSQLRTHFNGTDASPALAIGATDNFGLFNATNQALGFSVGGVEKLRITTGGIVRAQSDGTFETGDGSDGAPGFAFVSDNSFGVWKDAGAIAICAGTTVARFNNTPQLTMAGDGSANDPTYTWDSSPTYGLYAGAGSYVGITAAAADVARFSSTGSTLHANGTATNPAMAFINGTNWGFYFTPLTPSMSLSVAGAQAVEYTNAVIIHYGNSVYEAVDQTGIGVSGGTTGRIRYNTASSAFQISANGGAYANIATGSAGAPVGAQYLVLAADATLTVERVFTAGTGISVVDGGAGAAYTVSVDQAFSPTWTGLHTFNRGTSPLDAILIDMAQPGVAGQRDSHNFVMRGTSFDTGGHNRDFKFFVDMLDNAGDGRLSLQNRLDAGGYGNSIFFTAAGGIGVTADYSQGGVVLFESDHDFNVDLIPVSDNAKTLGSSARRFTTASIQQTNVYTSASDANPVLRISTQGLEMGAGGASALDMRFYRSAANQWDMGSNDSLNVGSGGSAASPSLTINTTARGFYSPAVDIIGVGCDGADMVRWEGSPKRMQFRAPTGSCEPETDSQWNFGTATLRFTTSVFNTYEVYAAAAEANPTVRLTTNSIKLGVNSADALSVTLSAGAANRLDLAAGDTFRLNTDRGIAFEGTQTSSAGASVGTLTNAPAAGDPGFWLKIVINGTNYAVPAWVG